MNSVPPASSAQSVVPPPVSSIAPISKPNSHVVVKIVAGAVMLTIGIGIGLALGKYSPKQISSYEECVKANGSVVLKSYPGRCITANGLRFTQPLTDDEKKKLQPPDEIINRKTYTDDDFSLQYPSEWKTNPSTNSFKQGDAISIYTTVQYNAKVSNQNFLLTAAKPVQTTLGLRDWIDRENILTAYTGNEAPKLSKDAILGGEPAVKIEGCGGGCFTFLYTKYNGKIYAVVYPSGGTVPENIQKTFIQILSTFKFTNEKLDTRRE